MHKLLILLILISRVSLGQIAINEVYINAVANDGSSSPDTGEWVEFYNTSGSSVDMSCWVFCDGDFCVTFPSGTSLASGGFLVVGSAAGIGCVTCDFPGLTPDVDWATCGCTAGSGIGIFTNGGEQVVLFDDLGTEIDAVYWSGGQGLPDTGNTSAAIGLCSSQTLDLPVTTDPIYENIGAGGGNGQSKARTADGGPTWNNDNAPTPGSSNDPLPIELKSFGGVLSRNNVYLEWTTLSELNNDYFVVERSADGETFLPIFRVAGAGNSTKSLIYKRVDFNPLVGANYYRLKQVDFDGSSEIFEIVKIDYLPPAQLIVYPQPADQRDLLTIEFSGVKSEKVSITIVNIHGIEIFSKTIEFADEYNQVIIDDGTLERGIYILKTSSRSFSSNKRLVVR